MSREFDINKICQAMGVENYDTALPQDFVDVVNSLNPGLNIYGHAVWSYDVFEFLGFPVAVDETGLHMLKNYWKADNL
jgi:hypothetical protein